MCKWALLTQASQTQFWKQSQAATDLDDIVLASSKLTKIDRIPLIYWKAPNLVKLPYRISVDYCNESTYSSKINFWHSKSVEYITVISRKYAHGRWT